jgi:hypothetical protein
MIASAGKVSREDRSRVITYLCDLPVCSSFSLHSEHEVDFVFCPGGGGLDDGSRAGSGWSCGGGWLVLVGVMVVGCGETRGGCWVWAGVCLGGDGVAPGEVVAGEGHSAVREAGAGVVGGCASG